MMRSYWPLYSLSGRALNCPFWPEFDFVVGAGRALHDDVVVGEIIGLEHALDIEEIAVDRRDMDVRGSRELRGDVRRDAVLGESGVIVGRIAPRGDVERGGLAADVDRPLVGEGVDLHDGVDVIGVAFHHQAGALRVVVDDRGFVEADIAGGLRVQPRIQHAVMVDVLRGRDEVGSGNIECRARRLEHAVVIGAGIHRDFAVRIGGRRAGIVRAHEIEKRFVRPR